VIDQTDSQLLRDYAEQANETAFAELVRRHVDFVYSAALRMIRDPHLAEDVTQSAFVALARSARNLLDRPVLSGWLHRTAQNIAAQTIRTIERRRTREQEAAAMNEFPASDAAWVEIAEHLDAALGDLSESDRDAVLLRYFEKKSAREMAERLGVSDDAAQKRVGRAVERLRESFSKRGVTVGASGLVVLVSANAVQAAPTALVAGITTTICAGTVTGAAITTHVVTKWIAMKLTTGIVIGTIAAATLTYTVLHTKANRQQTGNKTLNVPQQQNTTPTAAPNNGNNASQVDRNELLRLRGEVGVLRQQTNELAQTQSRRSASQMAQDSQEATSDMMKMMLTVQVFFLNGNIVTLTNLNQFRGLPPGTLPANVELDKFEVVPQASPPQHDWPDVIVLRERNPRQTSDGKWARVYGMVDGQTIEQISADGNFESWEKQHLMPAGNTR
jgi:RNA polymerase sigma factor (sigma-70 family)